jgi:hypothetical protein
MAVCAMLLADIHIPSANAQSARQFVSHSPIRKVFYSSCPQFTGWTPWAPMSSAAQVVAPAFQLLSKPRARSSGLNLDSVCLDSQQIKLLDIDPQSFEPNLYPGWPPKFCGLVYDGDEEIRFCTKG